MKKLLIGMALLGSIAFAEPMPEGSKQFQVLETFRDKSDSIRVECPPERDPPVVQAFCLYYQGSSEGFMPALDASLIEAEGLEPLEQAWVKDPYENRFVRNYGLTEGGTLHAVFDPTVNQATIFYTP
jgi:hypothetical protein